MAALVAPEKVVTQSCHARVGLIGNPSDGFEGKTLSFLIANFAAVVTIEEQADGGRGVEIVPNPQLDPLTFAQFGDFVEHTKTNGYYGGVRLVQAACFAFASRCAQCGHEALLSSRGCRISYDTDIPRMVGLSGSSAIIIAVYRGLMRFYGLRLEDLHIAPDELPTLMLDVERKELGIAAGLQDRVVQTYGGLVHMDFTAGPRGLVGGVYTHLDPALLPEMYLAYNTKVGGDSGGVHSTVKDRWARRDPELVAGMRALGGYADEAQAALKAGNVTQIAALVRQNFAMRRRLYGDDVVGPKNIAMVDLALTLGLSAKFTGSGGALVCLRTDGGGWFEPAHEVEVHKAFLQHDFGFVRIAIPSTPSSLS